MYDNKTKGIVVIRARARWHENGEKSTKHFLNLQKRNHVKKHTRKLNINGTIETDPTCILMVRKDSTVNFIKVVIRSECRSEHFFIPI